MTKVITRFAPSPTGYLHIGNTRTALINWLYAKKHSGKFLLRLDDTDIARSKQEYKDAIEQDLKWLGLNWDDSFTQSARLDKYQQVKERLIQAGRLYPCFESSAELEMKRKLQLSSGRPPIYDRTSLKLTQGQIDNFLKSGKKPHYRFLINNSPIVWNDMVKGEIKYEGENLSDPIVIREDGTLTYMLCSTVDDIDYNITHIIRGEDHVSNTAIQMQMFEALNASPPCFGHLSLIRSQDSKISKRIGGFDIKSLREEFGLEPMAINSFFSLIGSSKPVLPLNTLKSLIEEFDISCFSKSATTYLSSELMTLNHKLLIQQEFSDIKQRLSEIGAGQITEQFWLAVRPNLKTLFEIKDWWNICHELKDLDPYDSMDPKMLSEFSKLLPKGDITQDTWGVWISNITEETGIKGKRLFMQLRLALTGMEHGPELKNLLPLLSREEILRRLSR